MREASIEEVEVEGAEEEEVRETLDDAPMQEDSLDDSAPQPNV